MWPPNVDLFSLPPFDEAPEEDDEARLVSALEEAHAFPGFYPMVVIAREGEAFRALLHQALASDQSAASFRITERPSRKGTYVSYRVEVHVQTARAALALKGVISLLDGVIVIL